MQRNFEVKEANGKRIRVCLHDNCSQTYVFSTSSDHLRRHVSVKHHVYDIKDTEFALSDDYSDHCLVQLIVMEQLEYRLVESKFFKEYVRSLNNQKTPLQRSKVSSIIIEKSVQLRNGVKRRLSQVPSVALTRDFRAASNSHRGLITTTAHYITENFELRGFTLDFSRLFYPHDKEA